MIEMLLKLKLLELENDDELICVAYLSGSWYDSPVTVAVADTVYIVGADLSNPDEIEISERNTAQCILAFCPNSAISDSISPPKFNEEALCQSQKCLILYTNSSFRSLLV